MEDAGRGPEKGHGEDRPRPLPQGEVQVQKRPQAQGLQLVAVNGTVVFENGRMTGALPGAFLTRGRAAR